MLNQNQNQNLRPIPANVAGGASTHASQEVVDARQESQIWTTFALSPFLRASDIMVAVREGKATLAGTVADGVSKDLAKQIALGVNGIKAVDNQINVQVNFLPLAQSEERAFGEMVEDVTIASTVRSKMLWSNFGEGLRAEVVTKRGVVTLSGTADSAEAKEFAGKLAANTQGVRSVNNVLEIQPVKSDIPRKESTDLADGWITTKVKLTFLHSTNVDGSDISVSTHDGVVKLTGKTDGGAKRALAIELAGNVRGVKNVDSTALTM